MARITCWVQCQSMHQVVTLVRPLYILCTSFVHPWYTHITEIFSHDDITDCLLTCASTLITGGDEKCMTMSYLWSRGYLLLPPSIHWWVRLPNNFQSIRTRRSTDKVHMCQHVCYVSKVFLRLLVPRIKFNLIYVLYRGHVPIIQGNPWCKNEPPIRYPAVNWLTVNLFKQVISTWILFTCAARTCFLQIQLFD